MAKHQGSEVCGVFPPKTCCFKFPQRSIITEHPFLTVVYHWWIVTGKDSPEANGAGRRRVIALKSFQAHSLPLRRGSFSVRVRAAFSLQSVFCLLVSAQVCCTDKIPNRMSNLKEICSGLPLDPLPLNRGRDPNVPHAPIRTPNLTAEEERVSRYTNDFCASIHFVTQSFLNQYSRCWTNFILSMAI